MPLVTSTQMMLDAQKNHYAIGAFNVENMEMAQAVVEAAEDLGVPVMLQTTPSTVRYASVQIYAAMIGAIAQAAKVPVALHLDHGDSIELAARAIRGGYTSIMIDGSGLPFEQNIEKTAAVVAMAAPNGLPVEAELGMVGGKEDDLEQGDVYTNPAEAAEFTQRSGITSLAVAIGTAHGFYSGTPVLDVERLREIRKVVDIPLVLHGASGLSDQQVRDCIKEGICKVNFATELRCAYTDGIKAELAQHPQTFDPKVLGKCGKAGVKNLVTDRIRVCTGQ